MLAFCFTFIFFGPLEMVAFGGDSFFYNYTDVLPFLTVTAVIVFVVLALVIALLRGKIYNYVICVISAVTVCGYIQAALMNGSLGTLTGETVDWAAHRGQMLWGLAVWAAVLILFLFIMYLNRKVWRTATGIIAGLLVVMQLAPTIAIFSGAYADVKVDELSDYFLSEDGLTEYSKNDNTFVFVLDYTDYDYIEQVLKKQPDFFDKLDGFTGYTDAISVFGRTQPALNNLLTGCVDLPYNVPAKQFYTESWTQNGKNFLEALTDNNYDINLYANHRYLFGDAEFAKKYVSNLHYIKEGIEYSEVSLVSKLLSLSVYRYAPTAIKPFFWADTNYYNDGVYKETDVTRYILNDSKYGEMFKSGTAENDKNCFKLYHLFGAHPPYTLNADGTRSGAPTDEPTQTMGVFNNLYKAFDKMKELGIYDNATIIITADHGNAEKMVDEQLIPTRIALFYKPSKSAKEPFKWSDAQVSSSNIAATVLKAAGAEYKDYGTPLDEIESGKNITRVFYRTVLKNAGWTDTAVQRYEVTGSSRDVSNWKLTGTTDVKYKFYG